MLRLASKIYGMMNFLEQGTYGRIGANGLTAIKERQYERARELTPGILRSFEVIEAVLRGQPRRQFFIFPPPCLRFVGASDAALEQPRQGSGGFLHRLVGRPWRDQGSLCGRSPSGSVRPLRARRS